MIPGGVNLDEVRPASGEADAWRPAGGGAWPQCGPGARGETKVGPAMDRPTVTFFVTPDSTAFRAATIAYLTAA